MSFNQGAPGGSGTNTGGRFPNYNLRHSESHDHHRSQHQYFPPRSGSVGTMGGMDRAGGHVHEYVCQENTQHNMQPNNHWFGGGGRSNNFGAFNSAPTSQRHGAVVGHAYSDGNSWRSNDITPFHPSSRRQHQQQHIPNALNNQPWSWNNNHAEFTPFASSQQGRPCNPTNPTGHKNATNNNFSWTNFGTTSVTSRQLGDQAGRPWTNNDATPFSSHEQQQRQQQSQAQKEGKDSSNVCENGSKSLTELNQKWKARSERLGSNDDGARHNPSPKQNPISIGLNPTEQRGVATFGVDDKSNVKFTPKPQQMDKKRIRSFDQRYPNVPGDDASSIAATRTGVGKRVKMGVTHDQLPNWPWRDGNATESSSHSHVSNPASAHIQSYSSRVLPPPPISWGDQSQIYSSQHQASSLSWQDRNRPFGLPNSTSTSKYNPAPYEQPPLPPGPPPSTAKSHQLKAPPPPPLPPLPPEAVSVSNVLRHLNAEGIQTRSMSRKQVPAQNQNEPNSNMKESKTRKKNKRKKEKRRKERIARLKKLEEEKLDQNDKDDRKERVATHVSDNGYNSVNDDVKVKSGRTGSDDMEISDSESEDGGSPNESQEGNGGDNQSIQTLRTKQMVLEDYSSTHEHRDEDFKTSKGEDVNISKRDDKKQTSTSIIHLNPSRRKQELLRALKKAALEKAKAKLAAAQLRKEGALKAKLLNRAKKKSDGNADRVTDSLHAPTPSHIRHDDKMQDSRRRLKDISAFSMKSLVISGIGSQGPDEKVRYRILESVPLTRNLSENLDSSTQNTIVLSSKNTNESNSSSNGSEAVRNKSPDMPATIPEKLKLDIELARRKLKLQELKKAKAIRDNEKRMNQPSTIQNEIVSESKVEKAPELNEMENKQPEKLKDLRERLAKMKESIIVSKGVNRELKFEQQVADLRRMIEKQRAMLTSHGDNVRSCTASLRTSEEELKLERQGLEICQKRLKYVKQRKASTEKMVQSVTKKLMSLRKRREDDA